MNDITRNTKAVFTLSWEREVDEYLARKSYSLGHSKVGYIKEMILKSDWMVELDKLRNEQKRLPGQRFVRRVNKRSKL